MISAKLLPALRRWDRWTRTWRQDEHPEDALAKVKEEMQEFILDPCADEAADALGTLLWWFHRNGYDPWEELDRKVRILEQRDYRLEPYRRDGKTYTRIIRPEKNADGTYATTANSRHSA